MEKVIVVLIGSSVRQKRFKHYLAQVFNANIKAPFEGDTNKEGNLVFYESDNLDASTVVDILCREYPNSDMKILRVFISPCRLPSSSEKAKVANIHLDHENDLWVQEELRRIVAYFRAYGEIPHKETAFAGLL